MPHREQIVESGQAPFVDFYYDFISPYAYLASTQVPGFSRKHRVRVRWVPVNLPKLIKLSGNVPPATIPRKAVYLVRDLKRWSQYLGVPFRLIRPGAFDSRPALWVAALLAGQDSEVFARAVFDEIWSGAIDPTKEQWLAQIADRRSLPSEWLAFDEQEARQRLEDNTSAALDAGAFGVPSFVLHTGSGRPQLFWGVDRLEFLAHAVEHAVEDVS